MINSAAADASVSVDTEASAAALSTLISLTHLDPKQNGRHFADDIFKCIFLYEDCFIAIQISLKFVPRDLINKKPTLFQIMAWHRTGGKPLIEAMMA